jgi:hypothetical protein
MNEDQSLIFLQNDIASALARIVIKLFYHWVSPVI